MSLPSIIDAIKSSRDAISDALKICNILKRDDQEHRLDEIAAAATKSLKLSTPTVVGNTLTIPVGFIPEELTFNIGEEMYSILSFTRPNDDRILNLEVIITNAENTVVGEYNTWTLEDIARFKVFDHSLEGFRDVELHGIPSDYKAATVTLDLGTLLPGGSRYSVTYHWIYDDGGTKSTVTGGGFMHPSSVGVQDVYEKGAETEEAFDEIGTLLDELNVEVI